MSIKSDINSLVDKPVKVNSFGDPVTQSPIPQNRVTSSKKEAIAKDITSPLKMYVTKVSDPPIRVYQNNDDTSSNWVDIERVEIWHLVDANGNVFIVDEIIWLE